MFIYFYQLLKTNIFKNIINKNLNDDCVFNLRKNILHQPINNHLINTDKQEYLY